MYFRSTIAVTLGLALAAAGCGAGPGSPQVARLGTGATATTPAGAPAGSASGASVGLRAQNGLALSRCMRSHGLPSFPDPNSQGAIQLNQGSGINPSSAKFQAAQRACQQLLGGGRSFRPSAAQLAKIKSQALRFSACMRRHGVPDFPDPTFSTAGGGIAMKIAAPRGDLSPRSPTFQAAFKACQGVLPGKAGRPGAVAVG